MEWLLLGDLPRHADVLPATLTVEALAGKTMGVIATSATTAANFVQEAHAAEWLRVAGEQMLTASELRNHLLHARPATIDGDQRLVRWRVDGGRADTFPISDEWLDEKLAAIEQWSREIDGLRNEANRARGQ